MLINADFTRPALVTPDQYEWTASPQKGVERVMLDRVGAEKARATSIVRYAPASFFPRHQHPGGEEILVLAGTFSDEEADYPAGWYLRNPPGSQHQPASTEGALIFVKLRQMAAHERRHVRVDTRDTANWQRRGGDDICPLFDDGSESVFLQRLKPQAILCPAPFAGFELLVLAGSMTADGRRYECGTWIRQPAGDPAEFVANTKGLTVYIKAGFPAATARSEE